MAQEVEPKAQMIGGTTLLDLPPELLLRILKTLPPRSIVLLSSTCKYLQTIVNSQDVWRAIVLGILQQGNDGEVNGNGGSVVGVDWRKAASFLIPQAAFMGWFIAGELPANRSRLVQVSPSIDPLSLEIVLKCSEYLISNAYESPDADQPPLALPHRAQYDPAHTQYYLPTDGPGSYSPEGGMSVSVLHPVISHRPLFDITPNKGTILHLPTTTDGAVRVNLIPIKQEVAMKEPELETQESRRERMVRIFMGNARSTVRVFPTHHLVKTGGIRPTKDWISTRGEDHSFMHTDAKEEEFATCQGFRVEIRRIITNLNQVAELPPTLGRRRGLGSNGGPTILWDGVEGDPAPANLPATIIRAGDGFGGQMVFQLNYDEPAPLPPTTPLPEPEVLGESIIPTPLSREIFFPIRSPNRPIAFRDPPTIDSSGEILTDSIAGIWCASYGPHGMEFGRISVLSTEIASSPVGGKTFAREIQYCKLKGDENVPAGQLSWRGILPPVHVPVSTELASLSTIPSVSNATLIRWSSYDPNNRNAQASEEPLWEQGRCVGQGHVAGAFYTDPSWTPAAFTFVRSVTEVLNDREEVRKVDSIEEIRVTWLGSVMTFKRVRI